MNTLRAYASSFGLSHRWLTDLFDGNVVVQEKIDGSQCSFGVRDGVLHMRSKGVAIDLTNPPDLFQSAAAHLQAQTSTLVEGWTYRAECVSRPRHNTMAYDRAARGSLVLFDIDTGEECYLGHHDVDEWARRIGLDAVPTIYAGPGERIPPEDLDCWMVLKPLLGGEKIEGFVVKNYARFGQDKKILIGKRVSKEFLEENNAAWKQMKAKDSIAAVIAQVVAPEARWRKAVSHLRDDGQLVNAMQDMPTLVKAVQGDILAESVETIKTALYDHYKRDILAACVKGLPEWYRGQLDAPA